MSTKIRSALFLLAGCAACTAPQEPETQTPDQTANDSPITAIGFAHVRLNDRFWAPRLEINRKVTIPHLARQNEETGRTDNFRKSAGLMEGEFEGRRFNDTDIYKSIEAASYSLAQTWDPVLDAEVDELIELIKASQQDDGYLFPAYTINPDKPAPGVSKTRWKGTNSSSHELYGNGHMIEAAVAHYQATGKRTLLDVAIRAADHIDRVFGTDAGQLRDTSGHEEIELALVKLYDVTGEGRYLDLARYFLDERGGEHTYNGEAEDDVMGFYAERTFYRQDHLPVVEQREAVGHSVRAMYLYMGMADVLARTDAPGYREALDALWGDVAAKKMYLTGGIGADGSMESFGAAYQLPNQTAYAETCAAIGLDMWNHRMFIASGDARYLDVMERVLYNGFLSGVSLEGNSFFYTNPLQSDGTHLRTEYFEVACCPANLARLMGQLPGFIYARQDRRIYVNLFIGSEAEIELDDSSVKISQQTDYPWEGAVQLTVDPGVPTQLQLRVRIPGWARNAPVPSDLYVFTDDSEVRPVLQINGETVVLATQNGFAVIDRTWHPGDTVQLQLAMPARRVAAHPDVEDNEGRLAIQRGPLVYAIEAVDNGGAAHDVWMPADAQLTVSFRPEMLGGVAVLNGVAYRGEEAFEMLAVPYFAWANREPGEMAVWLPVQQ